MRLNVYASQPQYWRHMAPIVAELERRGLECRVLSVQPWQPWGTPVRARHIEGLTMVASAGDAAIADDVIYVEHGAGQRYKDAQGGGTGYAGGPGLEHARLFICPGERVGEMWRKRYNAPVAVVGCPALDGIVRQAKDRQVVATTGHWDSDACAETRSAWPYYRDALPRLREELEWVNIEIVGHAHPRAARRLGPMYAEAGIAFEPDPDVVLARADLLIADNTSLMYEAAALDIPILALNAPWYRRDVEHGLRFWSHVPGLQVDDRDLLVSATFIALGEDAWGRDQRARARRHVYAPAVDGNAAARAADAIEALEVR